MSKRILFSVFSKISACKRTVVLEKGNIVRDIQTSKDTLEQLESYFAV